MAIRYEKDTGDLVFDGFEQGIASSPHKGIANIKNANIATQNGEVMASFSRFQQNMIGSASTGTLTYLSSDHVNLSIANTNNLFKGQWIVVTGSSNTTQLPNGTYYVPPSTGAGFELFNYYNVSTTIQSANVRMFAVAGGGAGGNGIVNTSQGGGGGAGGVKDVSSVTVNNLNSYTVTVGAGGTGITGSLGNNGADSTVLSGVTSLIDAVGGGGGATTTTLAVNGANGGSGGGSAGNGGIGGTATSGQGSNGGSSTGNQSAGGGGGAGAVGSPGAVTTGGNGGVGIASTVSGASVTYAGGGGGFQQLAIGSGGVNGTAGTGSIGQGGAGAGNGSGSAGIVIITAPIGTITSATGGVHTTSGGNDIWTFTASGTWIPTIPPTAAPTQQLIGFTAGLTATITLKASFGRPLAYATESYYLTGTLYYRYYILDSTGLVWVYDTQNEVLYSSSDNVAWFLPDYNALSNASGIAVISGFLIVTVSTGIYGKSVATLGQTNSQSTTFVIFDSVNGWNGTSRSTIALHACYVGHQGNLYITDGSYIANVFPDSTIANTGVTADNVQSQASWTTPSGSFQGSLSIISGTTPATSDGKRVPAVFFSTGTMPFSLTAGTVYYIQMLSDNVGFQVYSAPTGGSTLDISTGSTGIQYFNTFYPIANASGYVGATPTLIYTNQRLALPKFETAQCMGEIGNQMIIGCAGNVAYPWDQVSNLPGNIISLPESNVVNIITVNQMAYLFAGNKANVYITDGSTASQVLSVPDYAAGVPGNPASYVEPAFTWGGAGYVRGRVYFSVQDETSVKAGQCGGVWSFIPTQNLYIGQDTGIALRLENENSYGTYNGMSPLIIPRITQISGAPLYWSAWYSDIASPLYGIDYTNLGTSATFPTIIESDAIPTGTLLEKKTFSQIEYKLSSPLDIGATVAINYRKDLTSAWKSCGTAVVTMNNKLSGYFPSVFEKTQWLQIQLILTPLTSATNSFIRMTEVRIR